MTVAPGGVIVLADVIGGATPYLRALNAAPRGAG